MTTSMNKFAGIFQNVEVQERPPAPLDLGLVVVVTDV
ncbi:MAG: hypothetical protein CM15mP8_3280 [Methanobacteriota archaeon]|nr:MAG: hypothetical protein CM15mP8_3280 [Euryarchaeota archaeon]